MSHSIGRVGIGEHFGGSKMDKFVAKKNSNGKRKAKVEKVVEVSDDSDSSGDSSSSSGDEDSDTVATKV